MDENSKNLELGENSKNVNNNNNNINNNNENSNNANLNCSTGQMKEKDTLMENELLENNDENEESVIIKS